MTILIRALSIFTVLLLPQLLHAKPLADFYQAGDGGSWDAAFLRAQLQCAGGPCEIELDARAYTLSKTVALCTPIRIVGQGVPPTSTVVYIDRKTAFRTYPAKQCPVAELAKYEGRATIDRLTIANLHHLRATEPGDPAEVPFYGVDIGITSRLNDVFVSGFVNGVRIDCAAEGRGTNCNLSSLTNVQAVLSEHAGIFIRGPDANGIAVIGGRSDTNCHHAARWNAEAVGVLCSKQPTHPVCSTPMQHCAGYMDLSMIGNSYFATHGATESGYPAYVYAAAGQRTTAVGVYAEDDTSPSYGDQYSNVVGGGHKAFVGQIGQWSGSTMPGLSLTNGSTTIALGTAAHRPNTVWAIGGTPNGSWPFKLTIDPKSGAMIQFIGNSAKVVGAIPWSAP